MILLAFSATIILIAFDYVLLGDFEAYYGDNYYNQCFYIVLGMYFVNILGTFTILAIISTVLLRCFSFGQKSWSYSLAQRIVFSLFVPPQAIILNDEMEEYKLTL